MTGAALVSALLVGLAMGTVGRLVVPRRRAVPVWLTVAAGVAAALLGTIVARLDGVDVRDSGGRLLVQAGAAGVAVLLAVRAAAGRRPGDPAGSGQRPADPAVR
ncbi:hypothetical protein [Micromonospora siamensis]|uniref:Transglycosylase associated protein n=1 Tax=Micromonospora siamensis TaxID=299152 RepID=A0A1C5J3E6_9ACTN|nr:hypothetical protein [Micromonospora siamensis]SCG64689.1 hypothetical protein GA0074704_4046 [Micromonospora siamensis]